MYKVGDKVIIKTIEEAGYEFYHTYELPQNRIVTIIELQNRGFCFINNEYERHFLFMKRIKGYANEYYLQEIKEELCLTN